MHPKHGNISWYRTCNGIEIDLTYILGHNTIVIFRTMEREVKTWHSIIHVAQNHNTLLQNRATKWPEMFAIQIYANILDTRYKYWSGTHACRIRYIQGILPKGRYPPCLRMADRALPAGYPRYIAITAGSTGECKTWRYHCTENY